MTREYFYVPFAYYPEVLENCKRDFPNGKIIKEKSGGVVVRVKTESEIKSKYNFTKARNYKEFLNKER